MYSIKMRKNDQRKSFLEKGPQGIPRSAICASFRCRLITGRQYAAGGDGAEKNPIGWRRILAKHAICANRFCRGVTDILNLRGFLNIPLCPWKQKSQAAKY